MVEPTSVTSALGPAAARASAQGGAPPPARRKHRLGAAKASASEWPPVERAQLQRALEVAASRIEPETSAPSPAGGQPDRAADQPDSEDGDFHAALRRRAAADGRGQLVETSAVVSQSMQASVIDWP